MYSLKYRVDGQPSRQYPPVELVRIYFPDGQVRQLLLVWLEQVAQREWQSTHELLALFLY